MTVNESLSPMDTSTEPHLYRMVVGAVGGQGGGAISEILFNAIRMERVKNGGEKGRTKSYEKRSMTPGLAQRSGTTITSLSFLDPGLTEDQLPPSIVISEMPHRGTCDVVIAQEMNELMKYIELAKPSAWVLGNEIRTVTPPEKLPGFIAKTSIPAQIDAAKKYLSSGTYIGIDSDKILRDNHLDPRTVNVVIMGMLSAAEILPISRDSYLKAMNLRFTGKVYETNVHAFEIGERYYREGRYKERDEKHEWADFTISELQEQAVGKAKRYRRKRAARKLEPNVRAILDELSTVFEEHVLRYVIEAYGQLVDFQGLKHANWYVDLVKQVYVKDTSNEKRMTTEFARNMGGRIMQWDGPIRIAEYAVHDKYDDKVEGKQIYIMEKKLQPTMEEIIGMIPVPNFIYKNVPKGMYNWYHKRMHKGRAMNIKTTRFGGYAFFWFLSKFKTIRPTTVRYRREKLLIESIMHDWEKAISIDIKLATELCWYLGKIRGYAETRIAHIEGYHQVVAGMFRIAKESSVDVAVTFVKNAYNAITQAGQGVESISSLVQQHLQGQYSIPLAFQDGNLLN